MPGRNKGFDPLSSLFEAPEPGAVPPAPEVPSGPGHNRRMVHRADPGALPTPGFSDADTLEDVRLQPEEPAVDKAAIARAVATAAAARLKPLLPLPLRADVSQCWAARSPRSQSGAAASDALAAARAAAEEEVREADTLRRQPGRPMSSVFETRSRPSCLPCGVPNVRVVNAIIVDQRDVLRALWTAHRTKFIAEGQLERAVGASVVLQATESAGEGNLVAAHVETEASDYLVWINVEHNQVLAAFPDARAYFAAP